MESTETTEETFATDVQVGTKIIERAGYFHPEDRVYTVQSIERGEDEVGGERYEYITFHFGPGCYLATGPEDTVEVVRNA